MIDAIQRFIGELRKSGVRVSPAEAIDAARAAQAVGVEPRGLFRSALKSTLSKTRDETVIFDQVFDRFFTTPIAGRPSGPRGRQAATAHGRKAGRPKDDDAQAPRARPGRLKIITASRRSPSTVTPPPRSGPDARQAARARPVQRAPRVLAGPADPRRIDLTQRLTTAEEERVSREVPRLIREIRLRAGRRYRRGGAGRLWGARLMRENLGTGGVPFVIPYRKRRPRRPRVIVMVDVSWSVLRASRLFLMLAREILEGDARVSVYLFVDRCVEATEALARWKGKEPAEFVRLLDGVKDLDSRAPSDYGRAFYQALQARRGPLRSGGRDTILLVLGDARNNYRDAQAWVFGEMAARCRRVIWLNPEPAARWNTGDSALDEYLPHCDVVCEAGDLAGIARGISEIARSL